MNPSSVVRWLEGLHGAAALRRPAAGRLRRARLLIGTFVPGEVILLLAGVVAATTGGLAWLPAALCATAGGFLADQLAFWLARSWTIRRGGWVAGRTGDGSRGRPRSSVSSTAGTVSGR